MTTQSGHADRLGERIQHLARPRAHQAFDASGVLTDAKTVERLDGLLGRFLAHAAPR